MDINAVYQGLADNANTITDLRGHQFLPDSVTPPTFAPVEVDIGFDETFGRGMDSMTVTCRLLVSKATDKHGQRSLNDYLAGSGPKSIKAALESDKTLGGACDALRVTRINGYGIYDHNAIQYYGAEVTVYVIGEGS